MQSAIQQQPVSIAIEADQYAFQAYKSGVLTSGCGTSLDHGVVFNLFLLTLWDGEPTVGDRNQSD